MAQAINNTRCAEEGAEHEGLLGGGVQTLLAASACLGWSGDGGGGQTLVASTCLGWTRGGDGVVVVVGGGTLLAVSACLGSILGGVCVLGGGGPYWL
jgi:hypothetical protein